MEKLNAFKFWAEILKIKICCQNKLLSNILKIKFSSLFTEEHFFLTFQIWEKVVRIFKVFIWKILK